jgi:predicted HicB family RNase H-like nuclease
MYTEKKKASNSKYLSKFKPLTLRVEPEEAERIAAAAADAGLSVQKYMLSAIRDEMRGQHASMPQPEPLQRAEGLTLTPEDQARAEKAAEAEALDLGAWISRTIKETASREALTREVKSRAAAQPPSPAERFTQRR